MPPALALLLDAPASAPVLPRLAAEIGDREAVRLYRLLARRTLAAAHDAGLAVTVWYRPMAAHAEMRAWLGDDADLRPQASGPLGARIGAAVAATSVPAGWLVVVRESVGLDAALLGAASAALEGTTLVVGPTSDGGCYLLGGRIQLPDAMRALAHARAGSLAALRDGLASVGAGWQELPVLPAIETAADARAARLLT